MGKGFKMKDQYEKMNYLIIDAEKKCYAKGHDMNWQRYSEYKADAQCYNCFRQVFINTNSYVNSIFRTRGTALDTNCI